MTRRFPLALILFLVFASALFAQEWVRLFDGKSLDGFVKRGGGATFAVVDGAIVGKTGPGENTFLCTPNEYGDFELEFEVMVDPALNSGVQIRSKAADKDVTLQMGKKKKKIRKGRVNGPQVEIEKSPGESGFIYGEACYGWLSNVKGKAHSHLKNGEWNQYRVVAKGPRIQTWLNGQPIEDLTSDKAYASHPKGFIAFQVHATKNYAQGLTVKWRNIRIKELK